MLKIVLVDDEQLIIHHLIQMLSSFDLPLKVVGTANNNHQALTIIRETHPNVVITDIRMGASNGLDLCDTLKVSMPLTKIIILSGFDEFAYAQKALSCNVFSYLLKPIQERELYDQLKQLHGVIMEESEEEQKNFQLKQQIRECLPLMQEWFFKIIRENGSQLNVIASTFRLFQIDIIGSVYQAVYIDFSQETVAKEVETDYMNSSAIARTIRLLVEPTMKVIYFYDTGSITLILSSDEDGMEQMHTRCYQLSDRILQYLDFNYQKPFSIGLSSPVDQIELLRRAVKDAVAASKYSFYIGFGEIICITDVEFGTTNAPAQDFKYIQEDLLKSVKLCDQNAAERCLHIFYLNVLKLHGDQALAVNKFLELYYYLSNSLEQEFDLTPGSESIAGRLRSCSNLEDIKGIFAEYISGVINSIEQLRTNKSRKFVDRAKEYMKNNYSKDISLESIAEEIGLSACYLSTLFKNMENISLKEYLTDIRIEASKAFLQDINLKIYEVAANVGYTDSRYFSQLFRKKTGYTPGQYREFSGLV